MPDSLQLKNNKAAGNQTAQARKDVQRKAEKKNKFRRPLLKTTRLHVQADSIWCVRVKP